MLTRREWLRATARLGVAASLGTWTASRPRFHPAAQTPRDATPTRWDTRAPLGAQGGVAASFGKDKLIRRSIRPPDYETPVALLDSFITPIEHFFVRSHLPVPSALDAAAWKLSVGGEVATPLSLSVDDLKRMPAATVTMTLECAGNGRAFFDPAVAGIQWEKGAVGTARWTGARLADILKRAGARPTGRNVVMNAADRPLGTMPDFVRQVSIDKAMHPDTLVAYQMNGQPIPPVHGFPLRVIVPGWEGAYSVKWVSDLTVIAGESDSFWVATAYRYPNRRVAPGAVVDAKDMEPLRGLPVKSLITRPASGATLPPGPIGVAGLAWAGELDIARVDISVDNGSTWRPAQLVGERARFTWRRFEFTFTATTREAHTILSRAADTRGRVQPAVAHWNPSGYSWNQIDVVRIEVGGA
jgi:DMSO/TMAO reductase YedYZ molybdopterin-dependent catalytic subunit